MLQGLIKQALPRRSTTWRRRAEAQRNLQSAVMEAESKNLTGLTGLPVQGALR